MSKSIYEDEDRQTQFDNNTVPSRRGPIPLGLKLPADEDMTIFSLAGLNLGSRLFIPDAHKIDIIACYCSLNEICFEARLFRGPKSVESCEAPEKLFVSHAFVRR